MWPVSAVYLAAKGQPKASTRLTRLLRMYAQGWRVLVGAEGQRVCLAEYPSRIHA